MTMRIGERLTILAIILLTGSFCYAVFNSLHAQEIAEQHIPSWTPPVIERCDLPTWERIRRQCS